MRAPDAGQILIWCDDTYALYVNGRRVAEGRSWEKPDQHDISSHLARGRKVVAIEVQNPDNRLRDGVTADIRIPISSVRAHRFSPAILVLNDAGQVGVRIVEDGGTVRFKPVRILSDGRGGVWVAQVGW